MKKTILLFLTIAFGYSPLCAQNTAIYPVNWWVGMKMNKIQLLIRSDNEQLSKQNISINYPGVKLLKTHHFPNAKYTAIDIIIAPTAKRGTVNINFGKQQVIKWDILTRRPGNGTAYAQGVTSADFIDLLLTDRFSNGDTTNDRVAGMKDQSLNRDSMYHRHGGDFKGIINHIDYFKSLGVTALWLTPVMENDMPDRTEHGYAITDHYKIDARYGSAELYKTLSDELHENGMKTIMDVVYNHTGLYHFLEQDPPAADWMHRWPVFTQTNYREQTLFDPYGAPSDKKRMSDGWFTASMPDVNHANPFMANYMIQNIIWYVQKYEMDGIRIDTYTYNDLDFANRCNQAIMDEFPKLTLFGETRVFGVANQSYFNQNYFTTLYRSNLQASVDFQCLYFGIIPALTQKFDWTDGVNKLYYTLSSDFLNKNPMGNVLLLDNHDEARFFSVVGEDVEKQKMGFQWLLTCRGIPQLYYGSEVLLKGFTNPDGLVRADFPGGWAGDKKNAFTGEGLTDDERDVQTLLKKLGLFRKTSSAIKTGKMMHYIPVDGLYVYFRYDTKQTVMCIMNTSKQDKQVDFTKYIERTGNYTSAVNVITDERFDTSAKLTIPGTRMWVLALER
ncbi:MAG: alpha-amylase [Sphingobacteriaceae bacterium]|nr:MAG: alpha-amylase [Sphingobacteriaceae bacterium]